MSAAHQERLKKIKLFLCDVDGVLTDGRVYWAGADVGFNRFFHVADGHGLKLLMQGGIQVGIISGGRSLGVIKRAESLQLDFAKLGNEDKRQGYLEILQATGLADEEALYMGDELFDLPLLKRVGFSAAPPDACPEVLAACHYVTTRPGGKGCVREVVDMLRIAQAMPLEVPNF